MQVTFDGNPLVPDGSGAAIVEMLLPSGEQRVQIVAPVRAAWSTPRARGQRLHTIEVLVSVADATTAEAMHRLTRHFATLPSAGDLVIQDASEETDTWPAAVLRDWKPERRRGVSNSFRFTFLAGAPTLPTP